MDIQKEREAFDEWHYNRYLLENPNIDISNAKYIYDYAHKNVLVCQLRESHFTAWQAAKAQAQADTKRIDFLADKSQSVANVMLPTKIVERNLSSLRDAIDQAMMIEEQSQ